MTTEKATPLGIALDNEALDKLEALARAATPGPWSWWTSNSTLRLTGADGRDGGVLYGYVHAGDGDVYCSDANQAFIAAANPATILALIAQARAAQPQPSAAPDGWQWAPIEPTEAMVHAGEDVPAPRPFGKVYRAMLAAAPSPNFAARGAEPAGMQVAVQPDSLRAAVQQMTRSLADGEWADLLTTDSDAAALEAQVWRVLEQLSAARQGHGGMQMAAEQINRIADELEDEAQPYAGEFADVVRGCAEALRSLPNAPQPTAAPAPQARPAGAAGARALISALQSIQSIALKGGEAVGTNDMRATGCFEEIAQQMPGLLALARHTLAAPTPHEQEARAAVPVAWRRATKHAWDYRSAAPTDAMQAQGWLPLFDHTAQAGMLPVAQTDAAHDVLAERRRQVEIEGWHPDQDDDYEDGQLSLAAACYAMHGSTPNYGPPEDWPWNPNWWKPADDRRNLVKAGALILADIERIDRAKGAAGLEGETMRDQSKGGDK